MILWPENGAGPIQQNTRGPKSLHVHVSLSGSTGQEETIKKIKSTHTHTHLMALCPGLPESASTRKVKPIWIKLKQETVSGSGINWAIFKSAPLSREITTPTPHSSVFYRPDALPVAQPTASKH